jgi:hypothetical protein
MVRDWDRTFRSWAGGPGTTEERHCENAIRAVRNAINKSAELESRNVEVFLQGSYRNRVNVRQDSDVDIGVVCHDVYFYRLPDSYTSDYFGITPATYTYDKFKNEIGRALIDHFGNAAVNRGNKAFDIKENSYRIEADVAPFFNHRRYSTSGSYVQGVEMRPDHGGSVINWTEQHYDNGVSKNGATSRRYKRMVRIFKRLCNEMSNNRIAGADEIPGFLIECLAWNVPNNYFGHNTYMADVRESIAYLFNNTKTDALCSEWLEVSELKYLIRQGQPWTRAQVNSFTYAAWNYVGFQ